MYEVLHKDNMAHVVKINDCPRPGQTQYGYVIFDKSVRTPGPVRRVDKVSICNTTDTNSNIRINSYLGYNQIMNEKTQAIAYANLDATMKSSFNTIRLRYQWNPSLRSSCLCSF